jgi:nucleoside-diphosphate-sugar epimerase
VRIFILGKTGFIGSSLSWKNTDEIISAPHTSTREILEHLKSCKPDLIVNLAAAGVLPHTRSSGPIFDTNIQLPYELGRYAESSSIRLVHFGSGFEIRNDSAPTDAYTLSKLSARSLLVDLFKNKRDLLSIIRPFNLFGPNEKLPRLLPSIIESWKNGKPLNILSPDSIRNFVYIGDFNRWFQVFMDEQRNSDGHRPTNNFLYDVVFEDAVSVETFCEEAGKALPGLIVVRGSEPPVSCIQDHNRLMTAPPGFMGWREGLKDSIQILLKAPDQDA